MRGKFSFCRKFRPQLLRETGKGVLLPITQIWERRHSNDTFVSLKYISWLNSQKELVKEHVENLKLARFENNSIGLKPGIEIPTFLYFLSKILQLSFIPSLHISVVALMKKLRSKLHWQPSTSSLCGVIYFWYWSKKGHGPAKRNAEKMTKLFSG